MRTTNENIRQLLEMLDNPDTYTEQEIQDIINRDEDTRDTYHLMVEAKRSSRCRLIQKPIDVDAAWERSCENEESYDREPMARANSSFFTLHSSFQKIAASFIGVLLVSGIAFAAIHIVRQYQKQEAPETEITENVTESITSISADTIAKDTVTVQPVIYDNIPLEIMLPEIAAHYDTKVTFLSDEVRGFRFRFVWNPSKALIRSSATSTNSRV